MGHGTDLAFARRWDNVGTTTCEFGGGLEGILVDVNMAHFDERQRSRRYTPRKFGQFSKARFYKDRELAVFRHCGGSPSYTQRILIQRVIRNEWGLLRMDHRLDTGEELSGHAERARFAMENPRQARPGRAGPEGRGRGVAGAAAARR
jgi:hypothetical protein